MPDWRYNVLSTSEAYINAEGLSGDPLAASYPRRADRTRPHHTCPYTTIFLGGRSNHSPYRLPAIQNDSTDPYTDAYSVDRSSNLTDTSSFARYEDCRAHADEISPEESFSTEKVDNNVTLQVQKVPYTSGVFFISTTNDNYQNEVPNSNLFLVEGSESDALSSCTCDSFERCEFDCRDFEPFSDTCCCDPLSDGVCSRSPKDVDSPEHFCDKVVEEDGVSARSDMEGLDLALFEPAQVESNEYATDSSEQNTESVAAALCGILYSIPDNSGEGAASAVGGAALGVPPAWEPFYCVLQQDRRTLTAYTSEELAISNNNGEYASRSLPRVRLDAGSNVNAGVRLRCWAAPPSITEEEIEDDIEEDAVSLRAMPAQDNSLSSRDLSPASRYENLEGNNDLETIDIDISDIENDKRSVVTTAQVHLTNPDEAIEDTEEIVNSQVTSDQKLVTTPPISSEFLNILGDSKVKDIPLGPKIPEEVSKRWGRILLDGLNKDQKKDLLTTILVPENFQLLKAPTLNQEISSTMTDSSRNRDKRLERTQNHLGVGIAGLTNIMSSLMDEKTQDINKLETAKKLAEVGQILLDLHYEMTINRRMLILPTLDKKFLTMTKDVKRDAYLFGENLGDKIKAAKIAEKSGLQIRNSTNIGPTSSGTRKYSTQQGNWRGPPRQQGQRVVRPGGNKQRNPNQPPKRTMQASTSDRYHSTTTTRPSYRPTTRK